MRILAIETSCDETSAAVIEKTENNGLKTLSNITASSLTLHIKTGGIIPETAAREQIKYIIPVINQALLESNFNYSSNEDQMTPGSSRPACRQAGNLPLLTNEDKFQVAIKILKENIDAIAVTFGPGLIGSLLVGVETAKTFAYVFNKPIIPVNHLLGHIYANFIRKTEDGKQKTEKYISDKSVSSAICSLSSVVCLPNFPFIGLIVSGGHTDLLFFKSHGDYKWLGGTRDDAAGEAFDKIARLLHLPYPGGPEIEKRARLGKQGKFVFKSPMLDSGDFDFSFSGLKTQVLREVNTIKNLDKQTINDISLAVEKAVIDVLVKKTIEAAVKYKVKSILLGGGVSANNKLREQFALKIVNCKLKIPLFTPEKWLCTDNAAMIGAYAALNYNPKPWQEIKASPELYFK